MDEIFGTRSVPHPHRPITGTGGADGDRCGHRPANQVRGFRPADTSPRHHAYEDARGDRLGPASHIVPAATIRDGVLSPAGPA